MRRIIWLGTLTTLLVIVSLVLATNPSWRWLPSFGRQPTRVEAYETVIRHLIGKKELAYVSPEICPAPHQLSDPRDCQDRLDDAERQELQQRLDDLNVIVLPSDEAFDGEWVMQITLGPVAEGRVSARTYCGNVCGTGGLFVVDEVDGAFVVESEEILWIS